MADKRINNGGKRVGAGRNAIPEEERKKPKTLKLAPDVWSTLDDLKSTSGYSQAVIVENLVRKAKSNPELID
jgi:hypothetical protein